MSVLSSIRDKCLDCCCGSPALVRECHIEACALHPYRMGSNPFRKKRELTDDQREELAARLKAARSARATGDTPNA